MNNTMTQQRIAQAREQVQRGSAKIDEIRKICKALSEKCVRLEELEASDDTRFGEEARDLREDISQLVCKTNGWNLLKD